MQKGLFLCTTITLVNFILILGNRLISKKLLNWHLNQGEGTMTCIINK